MTAAVAWFYSARGLNLDRPVQPYLVTTAAMLVWARHVDRSGRKIATLPPPPPPPAHAPPPGWAVPSCSGPCSSAWPP